jgi:hypothetical protein
MDSDGNRAHGVSDLTVLRHEWDVFISYARADNRPDATDPEGLGWVAAIKDAIESDAREVEGRHLRVFMDTSDIHLFDDWQGRILEALNSARAAGLLIPELLQVATVPVGMGGVPSAPSSQGVRWWGWCGGVGILRGVAR